MKFVRAILKLVVGPWREFHRIPVDARLSFWTVGLSVGFYFVFNLSLDWHISRQFENFKPAELDSGATQNEIVAHYRKVGVIDDELEPWFREVLARGGGSHPDLILSALRTVSVKDDRSATRQRETLKRLATGDPSVYALVLRTRIPVSGEQLLAQTAGDGWIERLHRQEDGPDPGKRQRLVAYLSNQLIDGLQAPIRFSRSINGVIQFLTVLVFCALSLVCWRRRLLLGGEHAGGAESLIERAGGSSRSERLDGLQHLSEDVRKGVYRPLHFLVGTMPSLGFIGTILGMSRALTMADQLLGASDKQVAISRMTEQLGYAFDTTLVALVLAIIGGFFLLSVESAENRLNNLARKRLRGDEAG